MDATKYPTIMIKIPIVLFEKSWFKVMSVLHFRIFSHENSLIYFTLA